MAKTYIEKRLVRAGSELCNERIERKGTAITAEDIRKLKVKTFPPLLQGVYMVLGTMLFVFGMWVQSKIGNMAVSMGLVLIGFLNVVYGWHGRPKAAENLEGLNFSDLTAKITRSFTSQQDAERTSDE